MTSVTDYPRGDCYCCACYGVYGPVLSAVRPMRCIHQALCSGITTDSVLIFAVIPAHLTTAQKPESYSASADHQGIKLFMKVIGRETL